MSQNKKYIILVIFSFIALLIFLFLSNFLNSDFKARENIELADQKLNYDPLITKADDFYRSFIREHNLVWQNGNLQVQIFCDFSSLDCKKVWQYLQQIRSENLAVSIAWKHFPTPLNPVSQSASRATLCAREQGAFWEFGDLVFENQEILDELYFIDFLKKLNLDYEKFETCFNNENVLELIGQDMEDTQKLQVNNFPYAIVGSVRLDKDSIGELSNVILSEAKNL